LAASLLAAGCGGSKSDDESNSTDPTAQGNGDDGLNVEAGESGLEEAGEPQRGGKLVYGIEGESSAGWCLSEAQLAISGMMVARAFYDTLTVPNANGEYVPYLAQDVTPNDDYTQWTITLREGIKFHDGTDLTAEVVKNNLDAYRGAYEGRASTLFLFVLQDIDSTEVTAPDTVQVNMKRPWVSFPAFLFSSSRMGMMAQAQLDADPAGCSEHPIGTGPFEFVSWTQNQQMTGKAFADYWQIAPDGEPFPYVDEIEFRPIPDGTVRKQAIQSGGINIMHTSDAEQIQNDFLKMRNDGDVNLLVSEAQAEVSFIQMNSTIPPFNDVRMRRALAMGSDREDVNQQVNAGLPTVATGPFAPGTPGFLEDAGFPEYDPETAKALVEEYLAENPDQPASFTLLATTDPTVRKIAQLIQQRARDIGVTVEIQSVEQATLIDSAIAKNYQAMVFRNYPGGDPDQNYVWWYGNANPVNFGGWDDPELNALLDEGRETADPDEREKIYQDVNRIMAEKVYGMWSWYTPWAIVLDDTVHNVFGPPLPGDDPSQPGDATTDDDARRPTRGLAVGHPLIGLWIEQ